MRKIIPLEILWEKITVTVSCVSTLRNHKYNSYFYDKRFPARQQLELLGRAGLVKKFQFANKLSSNVQNRNHLEKFYFVTGKRNFPTTSNCCHIFIRIRCNVSRKGVHVVEKRRLHDVTPMSQSLTTGLRRNW